MQHLTVMTPLVEEYLSILQAQCNGCSDDWVMKEHKRRLTTWLKDLDLPDGVTVEEQTIKRLAAGSSSQVTSWQGYDINGYLFYSIRLELGKQRKLQGPECIRLGVYLRETPPRPYMRA